MKDSVQVTHRVFLAFVLKGARNKHPGTNSDENQVADEIDVDSKAAKGRKCKQEEILGRKTYKRNKVSKSLQ